MRLAMRDGYHVLAVAFDIIGLDVLAGSLVKQIFEVRVFVGNAASHCPHGVAQTDWGALIRSPVTVSAVVSATFPMVDLQIHGSEIAVLVNHGHRWMHLFKVYLMQLINRLLRRQWFLQPQANHFPGELPTGAIHRHAHVVKVVKVVDRRLAGRFGSIVPAVSFAIDIHHRLAVGHARCARCVDILRRAVWLRWGILRLEKRFDLFYNTD